MNNRFMSLSSLWDIMLQWHEIPMNEPLLAAITGYHPNTVHTLLTTSSLKWSPFELMIITIYAEHCDFSIWDMILPLLSKDDMKATFQIPWCNQSLTLLHFLLVISSNKYASYTLQHIERLLHHGSDINQIVEGRTMLSYVVSSDYESLFISRIHFVMWCIEHGANPHIGHLLIYSCDYQYHLDMIGKHKHATSRREKDPTCDVALYDYLLSLGCNRHDQLENGFRAIEAVFCEGNNEKVSLFLDTEIDLDLPETCWTYAIYHSRTICYSLLSQLQTYHYKQYDMWKELVNTITITDEKTQMELLVPYVLPMVPIP